MLCGTICCAAPYAVRRHMLYGAICCVASCRMSLRLLAGYRAAPDAVSSLALDVVAASCRMSLRLMARCRRGFLLDVMWCRVQCCHWLDVVAASCRMSRGAGCSVATGWMSLRLMAGCHAAPDAMRHHMLCGVICCVTTGCMSSWLMARCRCGAGCCAMLGRCVFGVVERWDSRYANCKWWAVSGVQANHCNYRR